MFRRCAINLAALLLFWPVMTSAADHHERQALEAVLPLEIPLTRGFGNAQRHIVEKCTGTLLDHSTPTILTAWHCFDGNLDLTRPPQVRVNGAWLAVRLVRSGGGMANDWALLRFEKNPAAGLPSGVPLAATKPAKGQAVTLMGFGHLTGAVYKSTDDRPRSRRCHIARSTAEGIYTGCAGTKGDSGGPAIVMTDSGPMVVGALSGRNAANETLFVPVDAIAPVLSASSPRR